MIKDRRQVLQGLALQKRGWLLVVAVIALAVVAVSGSVSAQTKGIGLSPAIAEVTLDKDQPSASFVLSLSNTTDQTSVLQISLLDFGALDESGGIAFIGRTGQETTTYGLKQWMVLEKNQLTLEPGQTQDVKVTILNKDSLGPGGHYGAVIVSSMPETDANDDNVAVLPAASTLVLLKKSGGEVQNLELDSIKANKTWLSLPGQATLRFKNTGNIHLVPRGTVELFSPTGTRLSREVINPESGYVLPESFRQFTVPIHLAKQPWLPGRYRLVTTWRYDGTDQTQTNTQSMWYMGKLLLGLIIISCFVIVLILYIRYRRQPARRGQ